MSDQAKPILGISCGDLNGIGMEIIMKSLQHPDIYDLFTPVVFASAKVASYHRKASDLDDFNFEIIRSLQDIKPGKPNLINSWKEEVILDLGTISPVVGSYALQSLEQACAAQEEGSVDALVTAPIHKQSIQSEDFRFTGHTDYLEARFKGQATMMLVSEEMRMALATVHIPINKVTEAVSVELIKKRLTSLNDTLHRDFLLKKAKIAVLALNPHAGDGGVIGDEDQNIVSKAISEAFDERIMAFGPFPADSFFGSGKYREFDAILAMYHDQGLVPFKTMSFGHGVNYSSGLSVIRTSPDHGTGFDIAGKGVADESSFRQAMYLAADLVRNRKLSAEIMAKPLKVKRTKKED